MHETPRVPRSVHSPRSEANDGGRRRAKRTVERGERRRLKKGQREQKSKKQESEQSKRALQLKRICFRTALAPVPRRFKRARPSPSKRLCAAITMRDKNKRQNEPRRRWLRGSGRASCAPHQVLSSTTKSLRHRPEEKRPAAARPPPPRGGLQRTRAPASPSPSTCSLARGRTTTSTRERRPRAAPRETNSRAARGRWKKPLGQRWSSLASAAARCCCSCSTAPTVADAAAWRRAPSRWRE